MRCSAAAVTSPWPAEKPRPRYLCVVGRLVSRRDGDFLDAVGEIAAVIELGWDAWDKGRIRQLAVECLVDILGEAGDSRSKDFPRAQYSGTPGATSSACGSCSRTITIESIHDRYGHSPPPRFSGLFRSSALPDERQMVATDQPEVATTAILRL